MLRGLDGFRKGAVRFVQKVLQRFYISAKVFSGVCKASRRLL